MTQDNITPEELVKELRDCEDDCMECQIAVREVSCLALATATDLIGHVGTEPAEFTVNALIPLEDSYGDFFVTHWMPYPKLPQEGT